MVMSQVQKTVLHVVVSSVHNCRRRAAVTDTVFDVSDSIVSFNNVPGSVSSSTFQMHLLRLVLSVMGLEHQLIASRIESLQVPVSSKLLFIRNDSCHENGFI